MGHRGHFLGGKGELVDPDFLWGMWDYGWLRVWVMTGSTVAVSCAPVAGTKEACGFFQLTSGVTVHVERNVVVTPSANEIE